MAIELNHTIVPARDPEASAGFLAGILGLPVDPPVAHFTPVTLANHVTLDYDQHDEPESHHYAFLVSDEEFDAAFDRITERGAPADLRRRSGAGRPQGLGRGGAGRGGGGRAPPRCAAARSRRRTPAERCPPRARHPPAS